MRVATEKEQRKILHNNIFNKIWMLLLAKSEDIAVSLNSLTQGGKMLVFSYLLWRDNMRVHNILQWIRTECNVNLTIWEIFRIWDFVYLPGTFKVTKGQTDYAIRFVTYQFP